MKLLIKRSFLINIFCIIFSAQSSIAGTLEIYDCINNMGIASRHIFDSQEKKLYGWSKNKGYYPAMPKSMNTSSPNTIIGSFYFFDKENFQINSFEACRSGACNDEQGFLMIIRNLSFNLASKTMSVTENLYTKKNPAGEQFTATMRCIPGKPYEEENWNPFIYMDQKNLYN